MNPLDGIPDEITGGGAPGDERFECVTARRPVGESVIAGHCSRNVRGSPSAAAWRCRSADDDRARRHRARHRRAHRGWRRRRPPTSSSTPAADDRRWPRWLRDAGSPGPEGDDRGLRIRLLRAALPLRRRIGPAGVRRAAAAVRFDLDPHAAGRQRHVGRRRDRQFERRRAARLHGHRPLGEGGARRTRWSLTGSTASRSPTSS